MICPKCKKTIAKEDKYCPYCGYTLSVDDKEFLSWVRPKESDFSNNPSPSISTVETNTSIYESYSLNYADFGFRLGAFIIDYALILIIAFILGLLYPSFFASLTFISEEAKGFAIIVFYFTLCLSIWSSTPGKMIYNLKVIDEKTGANINFSQALVRTLSYTLSFFFLGLGFWMIWFDKIKHKGLHDVIAKTLVIKKAKKSLILPIILSIIAACFSFYTYTTYYLEKDYDFGYLGKEGTIINSVQKRLSEQPSGSCCSIMPTSEAISYLKEIPSRLSSRQEQNAEQIFENFSEAIVLIGGNTKSGEFGFGSGFLISPSGLLVTNYHVIQGMDKLVVALINKRDTKYFDVNLIVAQDPERDIAVLKIEGENLPYVIMGDSDLVKVGQTVFALGNPEGLLNTISGGMISQIRDLENGLKDFQITNPISEGSSGGALFNKNGEVIGITYAFYEGGQNLNLAIPINDVKELLNLKVSTFNTISNYCSSGVMLNGQCCETGLVCNDKCWAFCPSGQKFYCTQEGKGLCCPLGTLYCNNQCWNPCESGDFYCPPTGNAQCL